jgi:uncharacterized membrane protein HdeD (DUF308 family)
MKKALGNAGKKLKKHWKRNLILGLVLLGAGAAVVHHRIAANAFKENHGNRLASDCRRHAAF